MKPIVLSYPAVSHAIVPVEIAGTGIRNIIVKPHEFGDPHSLTIVLPPECEGKISLSRSLLREMADWFLPQPKEPPAEIGFGERE